MPQNFIECDRGQVLLMPPSLREWLPEGHFAWFVLAAVEEMDLSAFLASYRLDGHGRAAHEPAMMVALLLYAYALGRRSSRARPGLRGGRRLPRDRGQSGSGSLHDRALSPAPRGRAGWPVRRGVGALRRGRARQGRGDRGRGTKPHANASRDAARDYERIAEEMLVEADAVDREEDERFGDARGDELPPALATHQGWRGWLRDARRRLDEQRAAAARPVARSRPERLRESKRRLEEELATERRANADYAAYRARGVMADGRRFGRPPDPTGRPSARPGRST